MWRWKIAIFASVDMKEQKRIELPLLNNKKNDPRICHQS